MNLIINQNQSCHTHTLTHINLNCLETINSLLIQANLKIFHQLFLSLRNSIHNEHNNSRKIFTLLYGKLFMIIQWLVNEEAKKSIVNVFIEIISALMKLQIDSLNLLVMKSYSKCLDLFMSLC